MKRSALVLTSCVLITIGSLTLSGHVARADDPAGPIGDRIAGSPFGKTAGLAQTGKAQPAAGARALKLFSAAPAAFIENAGQIDDPSVRYVFRGSGATIYHTTSGPVFQLFQREGAAHPAWEPDDGFDPRARMERERREATVRSHTFSVSFPGAEQIRPVGQDSLETKINYYVGDQSQWRSGVPTWGTVVYEDLWPGIDLYTYGRRDHLKYEFHVAPGADWRQIAVRYEGIAGLPAEASAFAGAVAPAEDSAKAGLSITEDGSLQVDLGDGWGSLMDDAPYIYQEVAGERKKITGRFELLDDHTYAFEITAAVDPAATLIIDPELAWSTYLGASGGDYGWGIAVDASGVYVTGYTESPAWTSGGFDTSYGGEGDAFVAKLTHSGGHAWSTYLGGSRYDKGRGVAVDASGVYVTGVTYSAAWISGGFDTIHNGFHDAFVAKLTHTGGTGWSTYLGGWHNDEGQGIAVDASGVYVTGYTCSAGWTSGGFDTVYNGSWDRGDAFIAKLTHSGGHAWSTYLGGSLGEEGNGIAVYASGVYVTGYTDSPGWTSAGFDTTYNGSRDAFAARLTLSGGHAWSTYLGGSAFDPGYSIAVDESGVYVTGSTNSAWPSGGFDTTYNDGERDAFVAELTHSGGHTWSTYLGGIDADSASGIAADASGVYVTGCTKSPGWTSGGFDTSHNGGWDAFVARIGPRLAVRSLPVQGISIGGDAGGNTDYVRDFEKGTSVSLVAPAVATMGEGVRYNFLHWLIDADAQPDGQATIHVIMDTHHTVTAVYETQRWALAVSSPPIGGVEVTGDNPGTTPYTAQCDDQAEVTLQVFPYGLLSSGGCLYRFLWWAVDGTPQLRGEGQLTLTMDTDHTAEAVYNLFGDATGDCKVNVLDMIFVRNRLQGNVNTGDNWRADVIQDGLINILDLIQVRLLLGKKCGE
jgi:hypothetical protein